MTDDTQQKMAKIAADRTELVTLLNQNRALRTGWSKNAADCRRLADKFAADAEDGTEAAQRAADREDLLLDLLANLEREERAVRANP